MPGLLGTLGAGVTVYCTAMIYASLKSVQAWHTPLTPLCFLLFSLSGGLMLASLCRRGGRRADIGAVAGGNRRNPCRMVSQDRVAAAHAALRPLSTPETATGLGAIGRGAPVRAAAYERQLSDPRNGLQDRPQACREARAHFFRCGAALPVLFLFVASRSARSYRPWRLSSFCVRPFRTVSACLSSAGCSSPRRGMP